MIFIIVTLVLVAGIAFWQAIQGTFSAVIMAVLTVLSAVVAVNYYAPLSHAFLLEHIGDYADACSLAGLFCVTLIALRSLTDNLIRGNIIVYPWVDRIMAALISVPTALLLVGISSLAFQMLPLEGQVLLFNRFDPNGTTRRAIFPWADDFAAAFAARLSRGALSGQTPFGMTHPDWPGEVSAQRIAVQHESRHAVPPGTLTISAAWELKMPLQVKEFTERGQRFYDRKVVYKTAEKRTPRDENRYLAVRLKLDGKAADPDGHHRFGWGQVRLCGFRGTNRLYPQNYYAIGFRDLDVEGEINYMRVKIPVPPTRKELEADDELPTVWRNFGVISREKSGGAKEFDVVFEVPDDFTPWFVEYKRWARAGVPDLSAGPDLAEPTGEEASKQPVRGTVRPGWKAQFQVNYDQTAFTNELPFTLMRTARGSGQLGPDDAEVSAGRYARGTIHGTIGMDSPQDLDGRTGGKFTPVDAFDVPAGKALLRVECYVSGAETTLLRKIFSSVQRIAPRKAIDKRGNTHHPVGQYVMVQADGGWRVELQYDPDLPQGLAKPFRHVQVAHMRGRNVRVGFLFLIPPGVEMDRFEIGGVPIEAQSLDGLTAPQ